MDEMAQIKSLIREFDTTLTLKANKNVIDEIKIILETKVAMKDNIKKKTRKNKQGVAQIMNE